MTTTNNPIVILGAGVAGLAAAWRLSRVEGRDILVLEQAIRPGGLASTVDFAGMRVDLGSHRIHPGALPEVIELLHHLLGDEILTVPRLGRLRLNERFIRYPPTPADLLSALGPAEAARCGLTWLMERIQQPRANGGPPPADYATYLRAVVGSRLYELFYAPYARKVYGTAPGNLSVRAAKKRVTTGSPWKFASGLMFAWYRQTNSPSGHFYYPAKGFGSISDAFLRGVPTPRVLIRYGVRVGRRHAAANGIDEVVWESADGVHITRAEAVISTIPLGELIRRLRPTPPFDLLESAAALTWRGIRLLQLGVRRRQCLEGETYYFPEERYPFGRISEPTQFSSALGRPSEGTTINVEVISSPGDRLWSLDDDAFLEAITDQLEALRLFSSREVFTSRSIRLPLVYPVYERGFEDRLERLLGYAESFGNLYSIGRGGMFFHGNVDHSIMMGLQVADHLCRSGARSHDWRTGLPQEQFQVRD